MKRRTLLHGGLGALAACRESQTERGATGASTEQQHWRRVTYWPPDIPGFGSSANPLVQRIGELSDEHKTWLYHGGGRALWREVYGAQAIMPFMAGITGAQWVAGSTPKSMRCARIWRRRWPSSPRPVPCWAVCTRLTALMRTPSGLGIGSQKLMRPLINATRRVSRAQSRIAALVTACTFMLGLSACTINPVTGERQIALVSEADELAIGAAQYAPSRQMQGGDYILDQDLTAYVRGVGRKLAAVSDRQLPYEFTILNNSVPNAWALPGGRIAINRGLLLELDSEAELAAVLGHEIVHAAARHGAQAMQRGLILQAAVLITGIAAERGNYSNLVVGAASIGAQLINQSNSRGAELEADEYGMVYMSRAGYDPAAAIALQETFVRLASGRPDAGWLEGMFASHPPSAERVERNQETSARLPAGGEIGRGAYQAVTARLRATRPAYDAYDRGRIALGEGRIDDARALADEATRLYPQEALFHALHGDIASAEQRWSDAAERYRAAIARNDAFFYYPLRLGLTLLQQNALAPAKAQFETSLELLPTADAHYGLGRIAERQGDLPGALDHYRAAAGSSSQTGQAAQDAVVRLDLPGNPGAYLSVRTGIDAQGQLLVEISNPTSYSVTDLLLTIRFVDNAGQIATVQRTVSSTLPANGIQRVSTGVGPLASDTAHEVVVTSARIIER